MLTDENKLNDEIIEQINGGFGENLGSIGNENNDEMPPANINNLYTCSCCEKMYLATAERTDGFCPNCEQLVMPKVVPVGDIKTTIPDLPKKDRLVKIH